MKTIGLTGGIGSGKTTVARMFETYGIPIYIADIEAKNLMHSSLEIREDLQALLGEKVYNNGELDRPFMANLIFNDKVLLDKVNKIIHPRVEAHFQEWKKNQKAAYCIKEAAILFENDGYKRCDKTILVLADEEQRIARVVKRDNVKSDKVMERMRNQWSDAEKIVLADYIIKNENLAETKEQVKKLHRILSNY